MWVPGLEVVVMSVSCVLAVWSVVTMGEVMIVVTGVVVGTPVEERVSPVKSFAVDWFKWIFEIQFMDQITRIVLFMDVSLRWLEMKMDWAEP